MKIRRFTVKAGDEEVRAWSFIYGFLAAIIALCQFVGIIPLNFVAAIVTCVYAAHLMYIRRGFGDPAVILMIALSMYYFLPLVTMPSTGVIFGIPYEAGYYVTTVAVIAAIFSIGLSTFFKGNKADEMARRSAGDNAQWLRRSEFGALLSSGICIILTAIYFVKFGAVTGGDASYGEAFMDRLGTGVGYLLWDLPFGLTGLAFAVSRKGGKRELLTIGVALFAYVFMYYVMSQRKLLVIPCILLVARYIRMDNLTKVLAAVGVIVGGTLVFDYLGYMRITETDFLHALAPEVQTSFWDHASLYIGGETPILMATASAAHLGIVPPLPYGQDYWLAPLMCLPQFLFKQQFVGFNDRFALIWTHDEAVNGGGWGFSYFGEADAVGGTGFGGFLAILVAVGAMVMLFRYIYVKGRWQTFGQMTFSSAVLAASLPYALWFQRNSFSFFFKEMIFQQLISLFLVYGIVWLLAKFGVIDKVATRIKSKRIRLSTPIAQSNRADITRAIQIRHRSGD